MPEPAPPTAERTDAAAGEEVSSSPAERAARHALIAAVAGMVGAMPVGLLLGLVVYMTAPKPGEEMGALYLALGVDGAWGACGLVAALICLVPGAAMWWRARGVAGEHAATVRLALMLSLFAAVAGFSSVGLVWALDVFVKV